MTVISDTSPLCALAEIYRLPLLEQLFGRLVMPAAVLRECLHAGAPQALTVWATLPPAWVTVADDPEKKEPATAELDPGEAAAISLAMEVGENVLLLIDERSGVAVAQELGIPFTGTLGLLIRGHRLGLLQFEPALLALRGTRFRVSDAVIAHARSLIS